LIRQRRQSGELFLSLYTIAHNASFRFSARDQDREDAASDAAIDAMGKLGRFDLRQRGGIHYFTKMITRFICRRLATESRIRAGRLAAMRDRFGRFVPASRENVLAG
jgi:DNA-directed RNA polymerase specialized sigma24 family protein